MDILLTESPTENGYIESLINAYVRAGHTVVCDVNNFFYSNYVPDMLHIHWPERLYKWSSHEGINDVDRYKKIEERLLWHKNNGTRIFHTIHNLCPHDSKLDIDRDIFQLIIKYADTLIHHCNESISLLARHYPETLKKTNKVCTHGDYLIHYKKVDDSLARKMCAIPRDRFVILNFGRQRPYKNEQFIISVFDSLDISSKYLVIAGQFEYPDNKPASRRFFRLRNRIRKQWNFTNKKYLYRYFPTHEIPDIISSSDIIFLGQQNALNSGLLSLAATYSKPVVYPNIGCFQEAMSGWHHEAYKAGDIADATRSLQTMYARVVERKNKSEIFDNSDWLTNNSWDNHVKNIFLNIQEQ